MIFYSIRVIEADTEAEALIKIENNEFVDDHEYSDIIVFENELTID